MEKLISVIIPSYNVENLIDRCLESLEKQTIGIDNLEIILVDDASTDGTWNRILSFETKYPESVVAIKLEKNSRQGAARNMGMTYASAELVTFVDSDDWIEPDMLEIMWQAMEDDSQDLAMIGHIRDTGANGGAVFSFSGTQKHLAIDTTEKRKTFILCMSIGTITCAKVYRKSFLVNNNIFYVEGLAYEDHMFALLLYLCAKKVTIIDRLGYHYWVNLNSTVMTKNSRKHYEQIAVDNMVWNECISRGYVENYREELEVYFLHIGFLAPLKNLPMLYEAVPYDFFLEVKRETLNKVPNYMNNKYVNECFTEFDKVLLGLLVLEIGEEDFLKVCEAIKVKKGIK